MIRVPKGFTTDPYFNAIDQKHLTLELGVLFI